MFVEFAIGLFTLVVLVILFLRRNYGKLEKCGIPVVKPSFCLGSEQLAIYKVDYLELDMVRLRKYGKVWSYYDISTPYIQVADPEMIKLITVKNFDHFTGHIPMTSNQKYRTLEGTSGNEWRDLRKALSPTFSSGKIKGMLSLLGSSVDQLINHLEENVLEGEKKVFEVKSLFQAMALDVISKCAFGIESNSFQHPNNHIFVHGKQIWADFEIQDMITSMFAHLYNAAPGILNMIDLLPGGYKVLWDISSQVVNERKKSGPGVGDFIDRLVEMLERHKKGEFQHVTKDQITGQTIIFILAGFETTSNTLSTLFYNLVKNPDTLERLVEEIDSTVEHFEGNINPETISEMPWLDACIKETLRMFPPIARNDRVCTKDWQYEGINIPKGMLVGMPVYAIHHNPELWPEPDVYKPERFLKENSNSLVPFAWLPFGSGPRQCIGERFAMTEIKIAVVKVLRNFNIEADSTTDLKLNKGSQFMLSYDGMNIKMSRRN